MSLNARLKAIERNVATVDRRDPANLTCDELTQLQAELQAGDGPLWRAILTGAGELKLRGRRFGDVPQAEIDAAAERAFAPMLAHHKAMDDCRRAEEESFFKQFHYPLAIWEQQLAEWSKTGKWDHGPRDAYRAAQQEQAVPPPAADGSADA